MVGHCLGCTLEAGTSSFFVSKSPGGGSLSLTLALTMAPCLTTDLEVTSS